MSQQNIDQLIIGLNLEEAAEAIKSVGLFYRLKKVDGRFLILTRDYRLDRINLTLADNKVVDSSRG